MRKIAIFIPLIALLVLIMATKLLTGANVATSEQVDTEEIRRQAEELFNARKFNQAEALYEQVLAAEPNDYPGLEAIRQLAIIYIDTDKLEQTEEMIEKMSADFGTNSAYPFSLCWVARKYNQTGHTERAFELFQYLAENFPEDKFGLWSQVEVTYYYIRNGDEEAADESVQKLVTVFAAQETLPVEIYQVAYEYHNAGKEEKALELHQYNVDHFPEHINAMWSQREIVYYHIRNSDDEAADEAFDTLIKIFSDQETLPKEIYQVGMAYRDAGNVSRAFEIHAYNVGNYLNYDSEYVMLSQMEIVCAYVLREEDDLADTAFENLLTLFSDKSELPKAILSVGQATWDQALAERRKAGSDRSPDKKDNYYFSKALYCWEIIINDFPESSVTAQAFFYTGEIYRNLHQYNEAIEYYQAVVENYPEYENAWTAQYQIAKTYKLLIDINAMTESEAEIQMENAYKQVVELFPDCPGVKYARRWLDFFNEKKEYEVQR